MTIRSFEGDTPQVHPDAFIHPDAVVIGRVQVGADSSLWPGVVARGDVNFIRIGCRSNIQDGAILHVARPTAAHEQGIPLVIGDDVTIGHQVTLHACTIQDGAMIGIGATVLDGAVVEEGAMVAAGSLVPPGKRVNKGTLWMGSPAKAVRELTPEERQRTAATTENYVQLARRHAASLET